VDPRGDKKARSPKKVAPCKGGGKHPVVQAKKSGAIKKPAPQKKSKLSRNLKEDA